MEPFEVETARQFLTLSLLWEEEDVAEMTLEEIHYLLGLEEEDEE
jgi:hypothetical protein